MALLLKYQGRRMPANLFMTGMLHSLQMTFGIDVEPFISARGVGMRFLDRLGPVKRQIISYAMGQSI